MTWYKQGTIALQSGSNVVLGLGTSWRSDVIPGEGLDAPDGRIYEISEVINNTELRLVDVFGGENIFGAGYQVIPNASMTKDLTRRVNALLTTHEKSTAEVMQAAEKAVVDAAAVADTADKAAERAVEKAKAAADSADQADVSEKSAAISKASSAVDSDRAMAYRNEANAAKVIAQESAGVASSAQVSAEKARDEAEVYASGMAQAIAMAATFTAVPAVFQAQLIAVTQPHLRFMVWNGAKYVRAPWHMPGILFHSHAPAASITHGIQVRADVNYNVADHPDLAEILGFTGGTFVLPEGRARVLRATDSGIGIDTALVNGVLQNDAGRNLTGQLGRMFDGSKNGAFEIVDSEAKIQFAATGGSTSTLFLNASLQWPTASEFRVKSLAATLYITR